MDKDIVVEYLNKEMIAVDDYKTVAISSGLIMFWGIIPAIFVGSYWSYIGIGMLLMFAVCMCLIFHLMSNELTLKKKIQIQALIFLSWYLQFSSLSTSIFIVTYGINYKLIFIYLPSVLVSLLSFILTSIMLKKKNLTRRKVSSIQGLGVVSITGFFGWRMASILDETSTKDNTVPIILICSTVVISILSIGFLNFQKLYYLNKIEKQGDGSLS